MNIFLILFIFSSLLIIPSIISIFDILYNNNFYYLKIYTKNIVNIYFFILIYITIYYTIIRSRYKFIRELIEGIT